MNAQMTIRNANETDFDAVLMLDMASASEDKSAYWHGIFERYVSTERDDKIFLVAQKDDQSIGFIVGEVRAWEFGSPPCGWVFALGVSAQAREQGVGRLMLKEMCRRMKKVGISTVRTMVDREDKLTLSFFRSQGLRTGRYIELEKSIDEV